MIGMRLCTGSFLTADIETEIFSATMAKFKKVLIEDRTADFTVMELHP
jgi:hypothetical protein